MKIYPPAKINLSLQVFGKRADGYHELQTIMMPIALWDEIELEPRAEGIVLEESGSGCPVEQNLAYRAARLFFETSGRPGGVHMRLTKHIPFGAGLGGGSSDAAAVLMALNEMFPAGLTTAELVALAGRLGADCPFFIHGRPALMGERGDRWLADVTLVPRAYLLVIPPFGISTAKVYAGLKIPLTPARDLFTIDDIVKKTIAPEEILVNALEIVAFQLCPELATIKQQLRDAGALGALMSGSGSTVFGVFAGEEQLEQGMHHLPKQMGYRYIPTTRMTGGINGDYRGQGFSGAEQ